MELVMIGYNPVSGNEQVKINRAVTNQAVNKRWNFDSFVANQPIGKPAT
jgi:hypothetical protein